MLRRCRCGEGLLLIARGAVRHVARGAIHCGRRAVERFGDIGYRALEFVGGGFDELSSRFKRARLLTLFAAGARRVRRRLAEEHERTAHIRDFVTAVILNVDIEVAIGDAPHGVAEET